MAVLEKDRECVSCAKCGRVTIGRTPKGGDGSALAPSPHKDQAGKWCAGAYWLAVGQGT